MFSKFKKLFNNLQKPITNQNGNILLIALVIITVLSFSITTIAGMTLNLSNNTTTAMENLNEESEAKARIRLAISLFETYVGTAGPTFADFDGFDVLYENNPTAIYGVTVINESPLVSGGVSKAYRFEVTLSDGRKIVMYDYVSDIGVSTTQFEPFEYTIGTSGDMVLNSGVYGSDTGYPLKMFADNIYFGRRAPYIVDGTLNNQELTSDSISEEPVLTFPIAAEVHYNSELKYCDDDSCFFLNDVGNPMQILKTNYSDFTPGSPPDQGTIGNVTIADFFGGFSYEDYIIDFINNEAPSGSRTISASWSNLAQDIYNSSDPLDVRVRTHPRWGTWYETRWPNNANFVDITEHVDLIDFVHDFQQEDVSMVYFGNDTSGFYPYSIPTSTTEPLRLTNDIVIGVNESLIVFGDLYLEMTGDTQDILGEIVVTGDCYITGGDKDWEGSLMVFGETFIDLYENKQFETNGLNSGITFMCKDNIHFISHDENHTSTAQSNIFYMFIYTEESIYIDAVNSRYNFSGVLFARALGDSKRTEYDDYMMGDGINPTRGIVINSFYGYVDDFGGYHDGSGMGSYRFTIDVMSSATYAQKFENLPTFESEVIASTGELNFMASEFTIE